MFENKKITKATFKSFVKKNRDNLLVMVKGSFDGMIDGFSYNRDAGFQAARDTNMIENTLGIAGVWLVNGGNDYFSAYEDENYVGIKLYNCCTSMIVAIEKSKAAA